MTFYSDYERPLYASIAPVSEHVNENELPGAADDFMNAVDKTDRYLSVRHLAQTSPE